jgi:hypothetical protein
MPETAAGARARHGQVAAGDQLAAGRRGDAVHAGNHGHGQGLDGLHHARALREQGLIIRKLAVGLHLAQVVARAKGLAFGGQHHAAHMRLLRDRIERFLQRGQHGFRQGIELQGAVQAQGDEAVLVLAQHERRGGVRCCSHVVSSGLRALL